MMNQHMNYKSGVRVFLMRWFHWTVEEFENLQNPKNCQVVVLEKTSDERYKIVSPLKTRD